MINAEYLNILYHCEKNLKFQKTRKIYKEDIILARSEINLF